MTRKRTKHKLSVIPTAYEESDKIITSKNLDNIEKKINALESQKRAEDEKAILNVLNDHSKGKNPLVKLATIESSTFQQALGCLLSIRNTETFETMMLLFEYMEEHDTNKIDKLTGTELLKLSNVKKIDQEMRHNKLNLLLKQSAVKIHALDPQKSLENYKNKKSNKGLVYEIFELLRIKKVTYSKANPALIVKLEGIELLPGYLEHKHLISKRYLPLQAIRSIPKEKGADKSRNFTYKLCLKFASTKKVEILLTLTECMNLGGFMKRADRNIKKKWKPIEKALLRSKELGLIEFSWFFKEVPIKERRRFHISLFGEISKAEYNSNGTLEESYYKYINHVRIKRLYNLNQGINLPFKIEKKVPRKEGQVKILEI